MDSEREKSPPSDKPTLLPSVFPDEPIPLFGGAEGYEGERLHEMFLSSSRRMGGRPVTSDDTQDLGNIDQGADSTEDDQPPDFDPLFTIVEDSATGEQHHPYVHYVFSDDEPDIVTNILLHMLSSKNSTVSSESSGGKGNQPDDRNVHERYILLDMSVDGRTVVSARSLSPDWQVLGHQVTAAPTFNESPAQGEAGLMLRIEGREMPKQELEQPDVAGRQKPKDVTDDDMLSAMDHLVEQFHEEMDALKRLALSDPDFEEPDDTDNP